MPKYEDFKVGDVWICRDGKEAVIAGVRSMDSLYYPIVSDVDSHTGDGLCWSGVASDGDLIRKKHEDQKRVDLSKPLQFKGGCYGDARFSINDIENVPEPQKRTVIQWAVVHEADGHIPGVYDTKEEAEIYCESGYVVVKLEGEYHA